jgi:hypothetical protein
VIEGDFKEWRVHFLIAAGVCSPKFPVSTCNGGVRLASLHFLEQLKDFQCGRRNDLDTASFRLRPDFDEADNVIEMHEHKEDFKEW